MTNELIPGLEGVPIAESGISFVDGQVGKLEYRGIPIEKLAENSTFEETAYLLMFGSLPSRAALDRFKSDLARHRTLKYRIIDLIKCLPETGHPMDALQAAVAAVGMFYLPRHDLDDAQKREACLRLMAKTATVVAAFQRLRRGDEHIPPRKDLSFTANLLYTLTGTVPKPEWVRILDICLILHADHTMNASTFAGRVVGSTMADPYCVVSSALGALSGPLHGGANEDVMALLEKIERVGNVHRVIGAMIESKEKIPGFGHRVYKTMDPRAKILKTHAQELVAQSQTPYFEIALEVEKVVTAAYGKKGIWPNVDFFSGIVYTELGIARDCFTPIFAIARTPGWLAHWLEQTTNNRIFRPRQVYIGRHDQDYIPVEQR